MRTTTRIVLNLLFKEEIILLMHIQMSWLLFLSDLLTVLTIGLPAIFLCLIRYGIRLIYFT